MKTTFKTAVACIMLLLSLASYSYEYNFNKSKRIANKLFSTHAYTLYCNCKYDPNTHEIDLNSCGMRSASRIKRAHKLEWEHTMPAEQFGADLTCWHSKLCTSANGKKYSGRKCCEKTSEEFNKREAELYNLWPSVGLVNQYRSNYHYTQFSNKNQSNSFFGCPFSINSSLRQVEPRNEAKGIVARANLFMSEHYSIKLSDAQRRLFKEWSNKYPPSDYEISWSNQVKTIETYNNPFIFAKK